MVYFLIKHNLNMFTKKRYSILFLTLLFTVFTNQNISFGDEKKNVIDGLIIAKGKLSQEHKVTELGYNLSKSIPMGGAHHPAWATCKFYTTPVAAEYAIHSMEHGAVWIVYDSKIKSEELSKLVSIGKNDPYVLISPVINAPKKIIVTAWGFQIFAKSASDSRIKLFINKYKNSKTTPELGAPCQGGLSDPKLLSSPQDLNKK